MITVFFQLRFEKSPGTELLITSPEFHVSLWEAKPFPFFWRSSEPLEVRSQVTSRVTCSSNMSLSLSPVFIGISSDWVTRWQVFAKSQKTVFFARVVATIQQSVILSLHHISAKYDQLRPRWFPVTKVQVITTSFSVMSYLQERSLVLILILCTLAQRFSLFFLLYTLALRMAPSEINVKLLRFPKKSLAYHNNFLTFAHAIN